MVAVYLPRATAMGTVKLLTLSTAQYKDLHRDFWRAFKIKVECNDKHFNTSEEKSGKKPTGIYVVIAESRFEPLKNRAG